MAILCSLAVVVAIYAVFWIAPQRLVSIHAETLHWTGGDPVEATFTLDAPQEEVVLRVRGLYQDNDAERFELRNLKSGSHTVSFDGLNRDGLMLSPGYFGLHLEGPGGQKIPGKVTTRAVEIVMGFSSKIFYFHVSSAMVFLIAFLGCALLSLTFLILRRRPAYRRMAESSDRLAHAFAEVGVAFSLVVLITGPIWAKPNWGVYWTWEPRLLLTLLTSFLFVGYLVLRKSAGSDDSARRMSAGTALIGLPAAYFIHVAVELWGGNHPRVIQGGGLHGEDIGTTFTIALCAIFLFAGYLLVLRFRTHCLRDKVEGLFLDLSELEDTRA